MKHLALPTILPVLLLTLSTYTYAESSIGEPDGAGIISTSRAFVPPTLPAAPIQPALADQPAVPDTRSAGIWPFGKKGETEEVKAVTPKSTRKAFFLSLLLPGLGEYYVGSKRGIAFLGVEAVAWWMYFHFTGKGNDLDSEFRAFADSHWRYSAGAGEYSYVEWLADKMTDNSVSTEDLPRKYEDLAKNSAYMDSITKILIDKTVMGISHALPSTKTQQYYEMIGKYPQFVYGWEDIAGYTTVDSQGNRVRHYPNTSLADSTGWKGNYDESIRNVNSPMRNHYEDIRYDSNQNLKMGQNGINLMIVNRIVSAIDAGRLAYHHNKGLESELSMVRVNVVAREINDHKVPMLMFTKKF
jgi:hypothetical protein